MRKLPRFSKTAPTTPARQPRHSSPGLESLEGRLVLSTTMAGGMAQGNLYGDQSVVVATPISVKGQPTQIQVMDTGDIGMGQQSVRTFVPFNNYKGPVNVAVGDFLHKGYHQLIVSTTGKSVAKVAVFDLYQTFLQDSAAQTTGVFTNPDVLQTFTPFPSFKGGAVVATGDFDGDGTDDMAVATSYGGARIKVYTDTPTSAGTLAASPRQVASFLPFGSKFKGGLSIAAGHLSGSANADLVVGTGAGGGSKVRAFAGTEVLNGSGSRTPLASYQAFDNQNKPVQVQLIESIVQPDATPVTGLDSNGLTPMFTPSNNAPLARGTIVAYNPRANSDGQISLHSLVSGSPVTSKVTLPSQLQNSQGKYHINMTSIGYMFDATVKEGLAPMVLVANAEKSNISLIPLSANGTEPVKNIFTSNLSDTSKAQYDSPTFPFGAGVTLALPQAVKVLKSDLATQVAGGTSGMLPARQVAYQSPFQLNLKYGDTLFDRYSNSVFTNPLNQTATPPADWYSDPSKDSYGPSLAAYGNITGFPVIQSSNLAYWQESMIAAGLQLMNRGVSYQHHHFPAWFGPNSVQPDVGPIIAAYPDYSYTPPGMQTPGVDCSDYSTVVVDMVTGERILAGVASQATVNDGQTDWGSSIEGTSDIYINNDKKQGILSWYTLALYYEQNGANATYQMLSNTLQPGDLLYYGNIPSGTLDPDKPLTIDKAAHVTIWTGQTMPIPGSTGNIGVPLLMDSHGGNIQTAVDSQNNPTGVVEPDGPQIRPFFVPNTSAANATASYQPLSQFMTAQQQASQNYYYFSSFTHAIRINFPATG